MGPRTQKPPSVLGLAIGMLIFPTGLWTWVMTDDALNRPGVSTTDIVLPALPAAVALVLNVVAIVMPRKAIAPRLLLGVLALFVVSRAIAHFTGLAPITF